MEFISPKNEGHVCLVGGFDPFEKYARQIGFIFPKFRGENKKSLKPPPSFVGYIYPKQSTYGISTYPFTIKINHSW